MNHLLLITLGSGLGGLCRYGLSTFVYTRLGKDFPYGTLSVNALGSFLIGFSFILLLERFDYMAPYFRSFLIIGFLGGFTTFSSFSLETLLLLEKGQWFSAFLNIFFSVLICVSLAGLGVLLGRQ